MKPHGKGTNGYRPYHLRGGKSQLAAASHDLDRAIARAKAKKAPKITGLAHDLLVFDEADEIDVARWKKLAADAEEQQS